MSRPDPRRLSRLKRLARLRAAETRAARAAASEARLAAGRAEHNVQRVKELGAAHFPTSGPSLASDLQALRLWSDGLAALAASASEDAVQLAQQAEALGSEHAQKQRIEGKLADHLAAEQRRARQAALLAPVAARAGLARNLKSPDAGQTSQDTEA